MGQVCEIFLGGDWIKGRVEHSGNLYEIEGTEQRAFSGYYFIADNGGICGLCNDMKVRIPLEGDPNRMYAFHLPGTTSYLFTLKKREPSQVTFQSGSFYIPSQD